MEKIFKINNDSISIFNPNNQEYISFENLDDDILYLIIYEFWNCNIEKLNTISQNMPGNEDIKKIKNRINKDIAKKLKSQFEYIINDLIQYSK